VTFPVSMCERTLDELRSMYAQRPDWRIAKRIKAWEAELATALRKKRGDSKWLTRLQRLESECGPSSVVTTIDRAKEKP